MRRPDALQRALDLLVWKILSRRLRAHGYGIMAAVKDCSHDLLRVEEGSSVPGSLSHGRSRADSRGMDQEGQRTAARVYELSAAGKKQLRIEESRWQSASAAINRVLRTV